MEVKFEPNITKAIKGGYKDRSLRAEELGVKTQAEYERILNELAEIRIEKVASYGEDRYTKVEGIDFDMLMCFSDIYRKYIRLKKLISNHREKGEDGESLRDTFMDLANYAIMGVQIYDSYQKEKK